MTGRKNCALQVPSVVPYKALRKFSKALYGTKRGTCSERFFRPVMLKWDVIKMEIKSFTVQYSKRKARSEKDKEKQLLIKLNDLQEKLCSSRNDRNLLNQYYTVKAK